MAASEECRERGVTSIEYAIIALLVALGMVGALAPIGTAINAILVLAAGAFP